MSDTYGPWATALDVGSAPRLSTFWKRRLAMLQSASQSRRSLTRRSTLWLVGVGILACMLPTFHVFSAAPPDDKAQSEEAEKEGVLAGGEKQESPAADAPARRKVPKEDLRYAERSFGEWRKVLVSDLDPETRKKAIGALGAFGANGYGDEATGAIIEALEGEKSISVASVAAAALGKIGAPAVPALVDSLKHERSLVRRSAAEALSKFSTPAKAKPAVPAIGALVEATRDKEVAVRYHACEALGSILRGAETAQSAKLVVPALSQALKDSEETVRVAAAGALGRLGPRAAPAVPALIAVITTPHAVPSAASRRGAGGFAAMHPGMDRLRAIEALGRIGPAAEAAIPVLTELMDGRNVLYGAPVREAIQKIQAKAASRTEDGALEKPSP